MTDSTWKSPYPVHINEVRILANPRSAHLTLNAKGYAVMDLCLMNPQPLIALAEAIDAWEVRIVDQNIEDQGQREFGRYRVEFWNEDDPFSTLICDSYEVTQTG